MTRPTCLLAAMALSLILTPTFGADDKKEKVEPGSIGHFKQLDKDQNFKLSGKEFWAAVKGKWSSKEAVEKFKKLDKNKDEHLDFKEFSKMFPKKKTAPKKKKKK